MRNNKLRTSENTVRKIAINSTIIQQIQLFHRNNRAKSNEGCSNHNPKQMLFNHNQKCYSKTRTNTAENNTLETEMKQTNQSQMLTHLPPAPISSYYLPSVPYISTPIYQQSHISESTPLSAWFCWAESGLLAWALSVREKRGAKKGSKEVQES